MRTKRYALLVTCLLAFATIGCSDDDDAAVETFLASMNASNEIPAAHPAALTVSLRGTNEVPSVTTSTTGTATLTPGVNSVAYVITLNNATSVTAAHIHDGRAGANGSVLSALFTGPVTGDVNGELVAGNITTLPGGVASWADYLAKIRNGEAYVNVHTTAFPDGAIRSQTAMTGDATFVLDGDVVTYTLRTFNASGVISAHIHSGNSATANGLARVTLYENAGGSALVNGTLKSGTFDASNVTGLTFTQLIEELRDGDAYVNVHTLTYTGGAIRGQIEPE